MATKEQEERWARALRDSPESLSSLRNLSMIPGREVKRPELNALMGIPKRQLPEPTTVVPVARAAATPAPEQGLRPTIAQVETEGGPYEKLSSGRFTTVAGPRGVLEYEGPARGGGSFSVDTGDRGGLSPQEWDRLSQADRTAIRVAEIKKGMQAPQGPGEVAQQGSSPAPVAAPAGGYTGPGGSWQPRATQFRNARMRVGTPKTRSGRAAALELALAELAPPPAAAPSAGPDMKDQIAFARLGMDQQQADFNTQMKQMQLVQEQQREANLQNQRAFENRMASATNAREQMETLDKSVAAAAMDLNVPEGFPVNVDQYLYDFGRKGRSPQEAVGIINGVLQANPKLLEALMDGDTEAVKAFDEAINAVVMQ